MITVSGQLLTFTIDTKQFSTAERSVANVTDSVTPKDVARIENMFSILTSVVEN